MLIRFKFAIPFVALAAGAYYAVDQVSSPVIKVLLEQQISGLEIGSLSFEHDASSVKVQSQAKLIDDLGVLASFENAEVSLDTSALGFGEFVMSANVIDVRTSSRWFDKETYLSKDDEAKGTSETGGEAGAESGSGFDLKSIDHREILERVTGQRSLETEAKIEAGRKLVKDLEAKWKRRYDALDAEVKQVKSESEAWKGQWQQKLKVDHFKSKVDKLKADLEDLKSQKFDPQNIPQLVQNIEKVKNLADEVKALEGEVDQLKQLGQQEVNRLKELKDKAVSLKSDPQEFSADIKKVAQLKDEILASGKRDVELLKKELDPKAFDAAKITRLLLGREWELKLVEYLDLLEKGLAYLPKPESEAEAAAESTTSETVVVEGRTVEYPREVQRPRWWLKNMAYRGFATRAHKGQDVPFQGVLENVSADERKCGLPPSFSLKADMPANDGTVSISGRYSSLYKNVADRVLHLNWVGRSMKGESMGAPDMRVLFLEGDSVVDLEVDLSSGPHWFLKGTVTVHGAKLQASETVKASMRAPLVKALEQLLASPLSFTYRYPGPIRLEDRVKSVIGDVFKSALMDLASLEQAKLQDKLMAKFQASMGDSILKGELGQDIMARVPALDGILKEQSAGLLQLLSSSEGDLSKGDAVKAELQKVLAEALGLQSGRGALKQQLEDRIKREAQARVQQLAQEKLSEVVQGDVSKVDLKSLNLKDIDLKKEGLNILFGKKSSESEQNAADPSEEKKDPPKPKDQLKQLIKGFPF